MSKKTIYFLACALATSVLVVPSAQAAPAPKAKLTVEQQAAAQQPLVQAANRISYEVESRGGTADFGGVSLGEKAVDLYWKGALPQWMNAVVTQTRVIAPVDVHNSKFSLAERKAAAHAVIDAAAADPTSVINGVSVPVGSDDISVETDRDTEKAKRNGQESSKVPVSAKKAPKPEVAHRLNDVAPFSAGNRINNGSGSCTTGWNVNTGARQVVYGSTFSLLTAGHCGWPQQNWVTPENRAFIGNSGRENVGHDTMTINTGGGSNRMYDGGDMNNPGSQFLKSVVGWDRTYPNEMLCTSGSTTGASCNLRNSSNFTYSYRNDGPGEVYSDLVLATRLNGGIGSQAGDSGGPVFSLGGDSPRIPMSQGLHQQGQVVAKGTISGRRGTDGVIYQDFQTSYADYGIVPTTALNIINARSSRCIDADVNSLSANPNRAQLWGCNSQNQQQLAWNTYDDRSVRVARNGKCLDADLNNINSNGARVQLWDCNNQRQQRWSWTTSGELRSDYNGKCLDADLNTIGGDGTRIQLWDCNGQSQQRWIR